MTVQPEPRSELIPRRWRSYVRFSVRGMIILVLLMGAGAGWMVRSARIQRDAVAAITNAGGSVTYDWEWSNPKGTSPGKPWAPRWLVDLIGVDYFSHVAVVVVYGPAVFDAAPIVSLGRLNQVRVLRLDFASITDDGLVHLEGLTKLRYLDLHGTQVSDAGLVHLEELGQLVSLDLGHTRVTDTGLAHLKPLTGLRVLGLGNTKVTDAGVRQLREALPNARIIR